MMAKTKEKKTSRILEAVHETARDLQRAGFISKRRMKEYDAFLFLRQSPKKGTVVQTCV